MKIFKAILFAIILLIWLVFTIAATVAFVPIVIICGFFPDEWFGIKDMCLEQLEKL